MGSFEAGIAVKRRFRKRRAGRAAAPHPRPACQTFSQRDAFPTGPHLREPNCREQIMREVLGLLGAVALISGSGCEGQIAENAPDRAAVEPQLFEPSDRPRPFPVSTRPPGMLPPPEREYEELFEGVGPYTGATHRVQIKTPDGVEQVTAIEVGDDLVIEGDMVLGTKAEVLGEAGSGKLLSIPSLGDRWPNGIVPYTLAGDLSDADRIYAAMDLLSQRTPVRFIARTNESSYVRFMNSSDRGVSSSKVGRQGGRQDIKIWASHSPVVVAHEIMHALGVKHEQSRADRDNHITYHPECVDEGRSGNFSVYASGLLLTPFDFDSIMLYSSNSFADGCPPLTHKDGSTFSANRKLLSSGDINGLFLLYADSLGIIEQGDKFGATLASGDFDDDGYQDLAIAATGEAPGADPASGAVLIFKGTWKGLVPWMTLTQESRFSESSSGLGFNEEGDLFGASLAVGDFNDDGVDDLAVGAPRESVGVNAAAGAVYVYFGYANRKDNPHHGLKPTQVITQGNTGAGGDEAGDWFGAALTAGDFDRDGDDDLAVGAPHEALPGQPDEAGAVFVFRGSVLGFTFWKTLDQTGLGLPSEGDHFGARLASGDLDGDGRMDLIVAAPDDSNWGSGSGAVFVYRGGAVVQLSPLAYLTQDGLEADEANDHFGSSLATGDLNWDGADELVVGASGDFGGRMFLFQGVPGGGTGPTPAQTFTQTGIGLDESGDMLGSAAVIGRMTGSSPQLVVSAPREVLPNGQRAGALFLYRPTFNAFQPWHVLTEDGLDPDETDDRLGSALAIADFGRRGRGDLAAGAPTEKLSSAYGSQNHSPEAGAVYIYRIKGQQMSGLQMLTQETTTVYQQ
ncbi:MAG: FG-GAP repeat protein [Myxococcaceae bacterium]|nr:FG-GAP repeat protein [Myxococcaceae bacterium]